MLHRDYLVEMVENFVEGISDPLCRSYRGDKQALGEVEQQIALLVDLDPLLALSLAPDSLVSMMMLSGVADSMAAYVTYALRRVADAYEVQGDKATAVLRRTQAQAVAEAFMCDEADTPEELKALDVALPKSMTSPHE